MAPSSRGPLVGREPAERYRRAWRLVRWKMAAIITFTFGSTLLVACPQSVATLNVVLRRESTNVIEKQISTLVDASRGIAPAILDRAGTCAVQNAEFRFETSNRWYGTLRGRVPPSEEFL